MPGSSARRSLSTAIATECAPLLTRQAFPRFKHTGLAYPRLAYATLWMMLVGITGRSLFETATDAWSGAGVLAIAASRLEVAAIVIFVFVIFATFRRAPRRLEFYDYYILASLAWFVVHAIWETAYFAATLQAPDRQRLLDLVATWQAPLREIQLYGFTMLMILGVSQRVFHHFYGFPLPNARLSLAMLPAINGGVLGMAAGWILMRSVGHNWGLLWYGAVLLLAGSVIALVANWGLLGRPTESDRSLKFLRTAYGWLLVSLFMLVFLPVYQYFVLPGLVPQGEAARIGFSHAYYGAIRHAFTVGFISLMIMGMAAKVVPTLRGIDVHALPGLWLPFLLVNFGCTLRVEGQTLTDFNPNAYPVAGVSGLLELAGLGIWGARLWMVMSRRRTPEQITGSEPRRLAAGQAIEASHRVGDVLATYPWLLETFVAFGFAPLRNPLLRQTLASQVTIRQACRMLNVDEQKLLDALNAQRVLGSGQPSSSLPILPQTAAELRER